MKRIAIILTLALGLAGCAGELQKLKNVFTVITDTTVSPQAIVVAANSFDAIEGTATQYLIYCRTNLAQSLCSASNRSTVIRAVRSGRAARIQLETYIQGQTPAPAPIYNVLITAINTLTSSAANNAATSGVIK